MLVEISGSSYHPTAQILEVTGISRQTLWRWRRENRIPQGQRFRNGQVLFTPAEYREILAYANHFGSAQPDGAVEIYLDNNATTQALPEVVDAVARAMCDGFGNPSSVHRAGARAREILLRAREAVAALLGTGANDVLFTSGATEGNNLVLRSLLPGGACEGYRLLVAGTEHSSILAAADELVRRGIDVVYIPVSADGVVDVQAIVDGIIPGETLVSVQWASNETGVLQPIEELGRLALEYDVRLHTDAVQAVGKVAIDLGRIHVDWLTLSGHKLHGPLGVGAIVGRAVHDLQPIVFGGAQEASIRPGTENVPAIAGLGCAFSIRTQRFEHTNAHTASLRDRFENALLRGRMATHINGAGAPRLPNTSNVRFGGVDGEALLLRLDRSGVRCSQSSACTNHRPEPSYVLRHMGLSEKQAFASIRFGFSEMNTEAEVDSVVTTIADLREKLSRFALA